MIKYIIAPQAELVVREDIRLNELLKDKTPVNVSIDKEAKAVYFKFSDGKILKTVRINGSLTVDLGHDQEVIGVEVIRIKQINRVMKKPFMTFLPLFPQTCLH